MWAVSQNLALVSLKLYSSFFFAGEAEAFAGARAEGEVGGSVAGVGGKLKGNVGVGVGKGFSC